MKSNGPTMFLVNGEERTKVGPQYVHFNQKCLKEYPHRKHNVQLEEFPHEHIIVDRETLNVHVFQATDCTFNEVYILLLFVLNTLNDEITAWMLIKIFDHCTECLTHFSPVSHFYTH